MDERKGQHLRTYTERFFDDREAYLAAREYFLARGELICYDYSPLGYEITLQLERSE